MIVTFNEFLKKTGGTAQDIKLATPTAEIPKQPGYLERIKQDFTTRAKDVQEAKARQTTGEQTGIETFGQTAGQAVGLLTDVVTETPGIKQALGATGTGIQKLSETTPIKWLAEKLPDVGGYYEKASPREKANIEAAVNILSVLPVGKAGELGVRAGKAGMEAVRPVVTKATEAVIDTTKRATAKIIKATEPTPLAPTEAVGQILQGRTTDISSGIKGLSTLETTGVKTYSDLSSKISNKITELAGKVDSDLGVDQTKRTLKDLTVKAKTTSGKTITTNPIKNALYQLAELYTKTGDDLSSANIKELITKAETDGLTNLEINDIARVYGSEFKSKAFSKLGDPLTSINAQMYENTRKSLKELARMGIKGKEAKLADKQMSALYDIRTLVDKNVEAVNKLQQKIQERGLFEKVGHGVAKYGDILTGGSLRGLVGGLLPRGAGYKVLNALDIQDTLGKNLDIIQKAIKSGNDAEIIKILQSLNATAIKRTAQPTTKTTAKAGATAQSIKNKSSGTTK